jgi:hypothetical protein
LYAQYVAWAQGVIGRYGDFRYWRKGGGAASEEVVAIGLEAAVLGGLFVFLFSLFSSPITLFIGDGGDWLYYVDLFRALGGALAAGDVVQVYAVLAGQGFLLGPWELLELVKLGLADGLGLGGQGE